MGGRRVQATTTGALRVVVGDPPPAPSFGRGRVIRWPDSDLTDVPSTARRLTVHATTTSWLRQAASSPLAWVTTRNATVLVTYWSPPQHGWSGRLGPLPGLVRHTVRLPRRSGSRAEVSVTLADPQPLHLIVAAALGALSPQSTMPAPVSADVAAYGVVPSWLPAQANTAAFVGPDPDQQVIRPYDLLLTDPADPDAAPVVAGVAEVRAEASGVWAPGGHTILVDATTANPRGYQPPEAGTARDAVLRTGDGRWSLDRADGVLCEGSLDVSQVDERHLGVVRTLRTVSCTGLAGDNVAAEAALLAQLAMTGVVLLAGHLPAPTADLLAPELVKIMTEEPPGAASPAIEWEIRSVRQRRAALRHHATGVALPAVVALVPPEHRTPSVSALLVSRRPDDLSGALAALEAQTYPELEIVLGLHGQPRTSTVDRLVAGCSRPVEVVEVAAGRSFGEALGEVTARSRGTLVTKVDDDDVYGPEHVWDLVLGRHYSGATIIGKASEFVYLEPLGVTVRRTVITSESFATSVAGGTMLLSRGDLEAVGGWRPLARSVDRGLLDRVTRDGGLTYRTHSLGFIYKRHGNGHTWDPGLEHFLHDSGPQWTGLPRYAEFGTEHTP